MVVLPSCSSNVYVSGPPGSSLKPNVQTNRSGASISRYSPKNVTSLSCERITILQVPPTRKSMSQSATSYFCGPHQCTKCSQDVCASNTSSRGASNTRD